MLNLYRHKFNNNEVVLLNDPQFDKKCTVLLHIDKSQNSYFRSKGAITRYEDWVFKRTDIISKEGFITITTGKYLDLYIHKDNNKQIIMHSKFDDKYNRTIMIRDDSFIESYSHEADCSFPDYKKVDKIKLFISKDYK